jgi:pyrroline-5-carboxylate reductase
MKELLSKYGTFFPRKALVVSIAAGISTHSIEKFLPQGCPVVRVMPNTPALLGAGMAAVASGLRAKKADVHKVLKLFSAVGKAVQVTENQMDLVTAVSGSGPAYFFHIVELMIETAVNGGLEPDVAGLLVSQTLFGAARMISETDRTPTELRVQVTSPGGTTQAAIETMTNRGMRETIEAAIQAATMRGVELGRMSES